jgi:hypothetical protein
MSGIYSLKKDAPLEPLFEAVFNQNLDPSRVIMERTWFRNILYYMGEQWIEWLVESGVFQRRYKYQPHMPTPVSNIIKDYVRSMKSLILNKDYAVRIWPNSNEVADKDAAVIGERYLNWADSTDDDAFLDEREKVAIWMIIAGTAFLRTLPNRSKDEWAFNTKGSILKDSHEQTRCVIPFNVRVDHLGDNLKDKRFIGVKSLQSREWIEDTFNEKVPSDGIGQEVNYQRKLMHLVGSVSPWKGSGFASQMSGATEEDYAVLYEMEFRPTKHYPEGRYVLYAGGKVLKDYSRLPIPVENNIWDYTITDFHLHNVPGRYWSDAGVDDLISPQNAINQIDQALEMNRKGLGRPTIITTKDMELRKLNKYGQSFLALEYDGLLSGGVTPKIHQGKPLPNQILNERTNHREVAQEAAGDPKNVLRGASPSGNASGILVDILREAAEQGHVPDILRYYRSLKRVYRKRLVLAKELSTTKQLIKIAGKGTDVKIMAFKGSMLKNNTDVRLELTSGISSTHAGRTQSIIRLLETGFWGDIQQDPDLQQDIQQRLGLGALQYGSNLDIQRAEREHSYILQGSHDKIYVTAPAEIQDEEGEMLIDENAPPDVLVDDPLFEFDNHAIHLDTHRKFALSEEFITLDTKLQTLHLAHMGAHQYEMEQVIAAQQAAQLAAEGPEEGANPEAVAAAARTALSADVAPRPTTGIQTV